MASQNADVALRSAGLKSSSWHPRPKERQGPLPGKNGAFVNAPKHYTWAPLRSTGTGDADAQAIQNGQSESAHSNPTRFLPWHRQLLLELESALQSVACSTADPIFFLHRLTLGEMARFRTLWLDRGDSMWLIVKGEPMRQGFKRHHRSMTACCCQTIATIWIDVFRSGKRTHQVFPLYIQREGRYLIDAKNTGFNHAGLEIQL
ncbi:hypothetical protein BDZ97DRAFT_1757733 [Flammula alnicola]|nr:hypothetical protein BDZ97DRAFT_1757733 [Flammula alnicola]